MAKKAALYIRLSAEDENEGESDSIKNQRDLLHSYLANHAEFAEYEVLEFCDDGFSGTNFDRPAVKRLLDMVKRKEIPCILVKDFSRFGRNFLEVCDYLDQIFPFLRVRFIAVNENYDSNKSNGRSIGMDVAFKALIYELYSRDISEKIRSVQQAKFKKGEYLCSIAFYGYARSTEKKNSLVVDEPAAAVVRRIFQMAYEGVPFMEIALTLNKEKVPSPLMYRRENHTDKGRGWKIAGDQTVWTSVAIRRILSDERYTGKLVSHKRTKVDISLKKTMTLPKSEWIVVPDTHEALVSEEVFQKVQSNVKTKSMTGWTNQPKHIFYGKLKCAYCNHSLQRKLLRKEYFYRCEAGMAVQNEQCQSVKLSDQTLTQTLLSAIDAQIRLIQCSLSKEGRLEKAGDAITKLQKQVKEQRAMLDKWKLAKILAYEEFCDGKIPKDKYLKRKEEYSESISSAEASILRWEKAVNQENLQIQEDTELQSCQRFAAATELTREMLEEFIQVIRVYNNGAIEIVWNFKDYNDDSIPQ